jgi:hypothetical protein
MSPPPSRARARSGDERACVHPVSKEDRERDLTSRVAGVVEELLELVVASAGDEILEVAGRYNERVAAKYVQFLDVVVNEGVDVSWRSKRRAVDLPVSFAGRAYATLERTEDVQVDHETLEGVLYEANARTRGFRLVQDDGRLIIGRFDEALYPLVGEAWNHRVKATIRVQTERLARSGEERRTFTLTNLEILGPAD